MRPTRDSGDLKRLEIECLLDQIIQRTLIRYDPSAWVSEESDSEAILRHEIGWLHRSYFEGRSAARLLIESENR
jgi:hypothetical protein